MLKLLLSDSDGSTKLGTSASLFLTVTLPLLHMGRWFCPAYNRSNHETLYFKDIYFNACWIVLFVLIENPARSSHWPKHVVHSLSPLWRRMDLFELLMSLIRCYVTVLDEKTAKVRTSRSTLFGLDAPVTLMCRQAPPSQPNGLSSTGLRIASKSFTCATSRARFPYTFYELPAERISAIVSSRAMVWYAFAI